MTIEALAVNESRIQPATIHNAKQDAQQQDTQQQTKHWRQAHAQPVNLIDPELITGKMLPEDTQKANERSFSKKRIREHVKQELLDNEEGVERIHLGVKLLEQWLDVDYPELKQRRLDQLRPMNLEALVTDIFVGTMFCQTPEKLVSISSQLAKLLNFSDKLDGIRTMAELLAVLCETDAYDLIKKDKFDEIKIESRLPVSDRLKVFVMRCRYLPPMVVPPQIVTKNSQSAYLTETGSLILKDNFHNDPLALDTINTQNQIPLTLDREFLSELMETPSKPHKNAWAQLQFERFVVQSLEFYAMMLAQSEVLYLTHRYDKRGRMYASGYHISTQGSPFKKASLELARKEAIEVPVQYQLSPVGNTQ